MNFAQSKDKLPRELSEVSELPKFIKEEGIQLFSKEEYSQLDIINHCIESNQSEESFFIIDLGKIKDQYVLWTTLFPRVKPYYAVKCCPNPHVIKMLGILGCNFDCASKEEIVQVNDEKISSNRIIYANPVKDPNFIKFARSRDVDIMTFDDEFELYKVKLYHPYAKLVLRIKTDDSNSVNKLSAKFGCEVKEAENLIVKAKFLNLNVVGVSFHAGSQCKDPSTFEKAIKDARGVFDIAAKHGIQMNVLDIGGGFPGSKEESGATIEEIAKVINECIDTYFSDIKDLELISEPGRFFASQSHTLVVNIIGKRKEVVDGEERFYYFIDEGIFGSFNCIPFDGVKPKLKPFNNTKRGKLYKSRVYGPAMDDVDMISAEIELPELVVGEWCYFDNFGAYTTAAATEYDGFGVTKCVYILHY